MISRAPRLAFGIALAGALCAGCATQRTADIRVNMAPNADLSSYRYGLYDAWPFYEIPRPGTGRGHRTASSRAVARHL